MADDTFKNYSLPQQSKQYMTEEEVRELISASLSNWTGVTRFRTIESVITIIADFTQSQHNHQNAAGGGQLNPNLAFSSTLGVPGGGIGVNTLTGIAFGNGAGAFTAANITGILYGNGASLPTAITPLAGTKVYYVSDTSGGAVTRKLTFTNGILTAET